MNTNTPALLPLDDRLTSDAENHPGIQPENSMPRLHLLHCLVVSALLPSAIAAQEGDLVLGERVRITHRCATVGGRERLCTDIGRVRILESDTLRITVGPASREVAIPRAAVDGLWVPDGTRGNFWVGAGLGLVAGALLGAAIGSTQEFCIFSCSPATGIGLVLGAPVGFVLGGVTGLMIRSEKWRQVSHSTAREATTWDARTLQVGVSVAF
jgi:hypothetical protein